MTQSKPTVIVRKKKGKGGVPRSPITEPAYPPIPILAPEEVHGPPVEVLPSKARLEQDARHALLATLQARWPHAFPKDKRAVKPWALGLRQDIAAALPDQPKQRISKVLAICQRYWGKWYWQAVAAGGARYDLDGNERGDITEEQKERARLDLTVLAEKQRRVPQPPPVLAAPALPPATPDSPA